MFSGQDGEVKLGGVELPPSPMLAWMNLATRWPSLADQVDVATALYGQRGPGMVAGWLDHQLSLVNKLDFAREFADHINLPGIEPLDYAHRQLGTQHGELVGGIRFYNRDVSRPFIEIVAHSFESLDTLGDCVKAEWSAFDASVMRLRTTPGHLADRNVVLDQSIHVGLANHMTPPDRRVHLQVPEDPSEAITLVANRYEHLACDEPELANNISPANADDLRHWHAAGQLWAVRTGDVTVGVLAIAPGSIGWLTGDEIQEEVISTHHRGHGYAASAQTAWAAEVATAPTQLLIGTIDRHNHASRASATRAGRRHVLDDVFMSLDAPARGDN